MRLAGAVAIGMTGIGASRFLVLNLAGAIVWAVLVAGAGYAAGQVLEQLLGDLKRIEHVVFAVAAAAGIGAAILVRIRRHRAARADAARRSVRA
jgi:membrane protein DedA with SNARE-associated domain